MRLLIDHCVDRRFTRLLTGHDVHTAMDMGWETLKNGALLRAAADNGFVAVITVDRNLEYQQNLAALPISVVVLVSPSTALASLAKCVHALQTTLERVETLHAQGRRELIKIEAAS